MLTAVAPSWVGSRIGKYQILRELGRGGMGEVYLAEDTLLGREVALKRLLPFFAEDEDFVARFKREARAVSRLTHAGLVRIHSLDWVSGVLLLDMEFVRGTSLLQVLQNSVVTPQLTARLARDVLEALAECHEQGIVHRDIKPSNILFDESMHAKLVDFGIATALADSTATQLREGRSTTVVLGTPRFMPPEAWDDAPVTGQWDLFALGVVLYECLTGEAAFKGTTTSALAKQITNEPLPQVGGRAPGFSAQFASVVDRLVLINPLERFATARDALAALEGVPELEGAANETTLRRSVRKTVTRLLKGPRPQRRVRGSSGTGGPRRVVWATLAAGIALIAGALAVATIGLPTAARRMQPTANAPTLRVGPDQFFVAKSLDSTKDEGWRFWTTRATDGDGDTVTGYSALGVLRMKAIDGPTGTTFRGDWAAYASPLARGFEQGPVTGSGKWQDGRHAFAAQLRFDNTSTHNARELSFLAEPDPSVSTRADFLRGFEGADLIPALIFNELGARNPPLQEALVGILPAVTLRAAVPVVEDAVAPRIDGILDEETWRETSFGAAGRVGVIADAAGSKVRFRRTSKGLYIGVRVQAVGARGVRAALGVMAGVSHPPQMARRGVIEFSSNEITERSYFDGDHEVPFPRDWEAAAHIAGGEWTAEVFIPSPTPAAPWRFGFHAQEADTGNNGRVLAEWGDPDASQLAHGALLFFTQGPAAREGKP